MLPHSFPSVQNEGAFVPDELLGRKCVPPSTDHDISGSDVAAVNPFASRVRLQIAISNDCFERKSPASFLRGLLDSPRIP